MTQMRKPGWRVRRIRLIGLIVLLTIAIAITWRKYSLPEMQRFTEDFDSTIGNASPSLGRAIAANPALHRIFLDGAKEAYDGGGWDAASLRVQQLKWREVVPYASDPLVLACAIAQRSTVSTGSHCPLADVTGTHTGRIAWKRLADAVAPCEQAIADGAMRRQRGETPAVMSEREYLAAASQALTEPDPLTAPEHDALLDPLAPGAPVCQAFSKFEGNALARQDARYFRAELMRGEDPGAMDALSPVETPPPGTLCPRAGTVFTLSMQRSLDGRPITWTTVRPDGWDCVFDSSATGRRRLWADDFLNPLRRLWPLAVGKTATITTEDDNKPETGLVRVESFGRYWLPIGWQQAYAISYTVLEEGRPRYVLTAYWSPALGFQIGQHTEVLFGDWPRDTAPDWQVIAVRQPG